MLQYSRVVIVYNPNSTGPSRQKAAELKKRLDQELSGIKVDNVATSHAGHAEELAYTAAMKYHNPLVISASGDGGYHEIVNGIMKAKSEGAQPIGAVLAAGNANDHRRTLRHGLLADNILQNQIKTIDLLKIHISNRQHSTVRYAHSYLGLGLTPIIAIELNRHSLNAIKELAIVLKTFAGHRPFEIAVNGKQLKLDSLVIANISQMAKVLTIAKQAKPNDGVFEVVAFPCRTKLHLLVQLAKAAFVGLAGQRSNSYQFNTIGDMPMQLDGEVTKLSAGSQVTVSSCHHCLATF
jgi:diacylglycerol kinase (ATP)